MVEALKQAAKVIAERPIVLIRVGVDARLGVRARRVRLLVTHRDPPARPAVQVCRLPPG